jgi:nitrite reductase/ring-hydroxylating ferredoxin subunit
LSDAAPCAVEKREDAAGKLADGAHAEISSVGGDNNNMVQPSDRTEPARQGGFIDVADTEDLPPGTLVGLALDGCHIAVANAEGQYVAFNDLCLRCGFSLASGALYGSRLICRSCDWQYDARCGSLFGLPALKLELLPVRVQDGHVSIDSRALPRSAA